MSLKLLLLRLLLLLLRLIRLYLLLATRILLTCYVSVTSNTSFAFDNTFLTFYLPLASTALPWYILPILLYNTIKISFTCILLFSIFIIISFVIHNLPIYNYANFLFQLRFIIISQPSKYTFYLAFLMRRAFRKHRWCFFLDNFTSIS